MKITKVHIWCWWIYTVLRYIYFVFCSLLHWHKEQVEFLKLPNTSHERQYCPRNILSKLCLCYYYSSFPYLLQLILHQYKLICMNKHINIYMMKLQTRIYIQELFELSSRISMIKSHYIYDMGWLLNKGLLNVFY